jgi:hypothetical protein
VKVADETLTPQQQLELARQWYAKQMQVLEQCHGPSWPQHREWISSFLKEELRQRLIARGWRPKRAG